MTKLTDSSCSNSDTDDLVTRAKAGDKRAVERLLAEARPRAMAVAMKMLRNPTDAEDAVQDALAKVWRYLPRFEGRASFFTWIHRIVMNSSLDVLRRERTRTTLREESDDEEQLHGIEVSHEETPEKLLATKEIGVVVRGAVAMLGVVHREAIELREFEELSYDEIAAEVGCPIGTVMSRLHHARRRLADELGAYVADDSAEMAFAA